ncbi:MAG TPA: DegT/DnrJ/EryC1/StrS family aminotransferase [Phycisphaerae bacterium]|nr:DegT/DnrJ/EryC1/StrS family aminotransferase [Phycisphaerae bacterium]HNU43711.1 DegT/DnrJ/EryC1/StrS family aminotransferase [Phycisphaerae bacterium]
MRQVGMLDLRREFELFRDEVRRTTLEVLDSQQFIGGPAVTELEDALRQRVGVRCAVAVSNGSDALLCTLMALGIGPGDEVIVPAFTFFATAGAVARVGATPVFVDIDPRTFNLHPERTAAAMTARTKAIMPVHLYGQCADMDALNALGRQHGVPVIEDACQALGATYRDRPAGALGTAACISFYPTKNLGGFGEGGMIFTDDEELGRIARQLRNHGESQRYVHERVGGNFRLDTLKAAILLVKLRFWDEFTRRRRHNAARYDELLRETPVTPPYVAPPCQAVYHQYTILADRRDELQAFLKEAGIGTVVYYPVPLHLQRCFAALGYRPGSLPATEEACRRVLSIPCHPMLEDEDLQYVAGTIARFYGQQRAGARDAVCSTRKA